MTYGNNVRDDSQQLRGTSKDIIAKLKDVNRKLALPIRVSMDQPVTPPLLEGAASQDAS